MKIVINSSIYCYKKILKSPNEKFFNWSDKLEIGDTYTIIIWGHINVELPIILTFFKKYRK